VDELMSAATVLENDAARMATRSNGSISRAYEQYSAILRALTSVRDALAANGSSRNCFTQVALLKAAADIEATAKLVVAFGDMCEHASIDADKTLASVGMTDTLVSGLDVPQAAVLLPMPPLALPLENASLVWRDLVDGITSTVSGRGLTSFVAGPRGRTLNTLDVFPQAAGRPAEFVTSADVSISLRDEHGTHVSADVDVVAADGGGWRVSYCVPVDCASTLWLRVHVCGVALGSDTRVCAGYAGAFGNRLVSNHTINKKDKFGIAVSPDGRTMIVSYTLFDVLAVYDVALPSFTESHTIGQHGFGPAEFKNPTRVCFVDAGSFLVCDTANGRVQHLTLAGEFLDSFDAWRRPYSIAAHGTLAAVGTTSCTIGLYSLETHEYVRRFSQRGKGPGDIGHLPANMRFTPDGTCLLVAEQVTGRLSLFSIEGEFLRHFGLGVLAEKAPRDVVFGADNTIIVSEEDSGRISVFSFEDGAHIKSWGSEGTGPCEFELLRAMDVSGRYLFVLDQNRVQVFE
jgi:hypothetical protein